MSEAFDQLVAAADNANDQNTPKAYLIHGGKATAWVLGERELGITTFWDGEAIFVPWSNIKYIVMPDLM